MLPDGVLWIAISVLVSPVVVTLLWIIDVGRVYRYYFLRRQYDVDLLRQGAKLLEGEHDFRNFCRIDAVNVCDFTRTIFQGDVVLVKKG